MPLNKATEEASDEGTGALVAGRPNSISPGLIESGATRAQLEDPEWAREMLGKTLLGRSAGPRKWRTSRCSGLRTRAHT
jgi:hypothetical protein